MTELEKLKSEYEGKFFIFENFSSGIVYVTRVYLNCYDDIVFDIENHAEKLKFVKNKILSLGYEKNYFNMLKTLEKDEFKSFVLEFLNSGLYVEITDDLKKHLDITETEINRTEYAKNELEHWKLLERNYTVKPQSEEKKVLIEKYEKYSRKLIENSIQGYFGITCSFCNDRHHLLCKIKAELNDQILISPLFKYKNHFENDFWIKKENISKKNMVFFNDIFNNIDNLEHKNYSASEDLLEILNSSDFKEFIEVNEKLSKLNKQRDVPEIKNPDVSFQDLLLIGGAVFGASTAGTIFNKLTSQNKKQIALGSK